MAMQNPHIDNKLLGKGIGAQWKLIFAWERFSVTVPQIPRDAQADWVLGRAWANEGGSFQPWLVRYKQFLYFDPSTWNLP